MVLTPQEHADAILKEWQESGERERIAEMRRRLEGLSKRLSDTREVYIESDQ